MKELKNDWHYIIEWKCDGGHMVTRKGQCKAGDSFHSVMICRQCGGVAQWHDSIVWPLGTLGAWEEEEL